ncbi:MAG: Periplasmic thiol:disulfide interchange protein DsbA, partial [Parcubacteria group bacterium GW2011_GWA2_47_8]
LLVVMFKGNVSPGALKNRAAGDRVATAPTPAPAPTAPAPQAAGQVPPVTSSDHVRGSANAAITLVEYSDYECPFCKSFHPTMQRLMTEYNGKVKWVYRHFPLSFHQNAEKEAEAAECVAELAGNDAFWKFIDRVYEVTPANNGLDLATLPDIAVYAGVNKTKFQTCVDSGKYDAVIAQDIQDAVTAGAQGTPYAVIIDAKGQNNPVTGALPFENWKTVIDSLLAEQS